MQFDIDVYVATVDGNDTAYLEKMQQRIVEEGLEEDVQSTGRRRINDYGEIRLLLDSIERNMPWVRKVHLCVHDGQTPRWLDETIFLKEKVVVHEHASYFDVDIRLPTFNSFAIDTQGKNVPDLAEHFIFMDNDMFIPKPLSPDHYFDASGLPRLNFGLHEMSLYAGGLVWEDVYLLENQLCIQAFGHLDDNTNLIATINHGPLPSLRSALLETHRLFAPWLEATKSHSFRHREDVSFYLHRLLALYSGNFVSTQSSVGFFPTSNFPAGIGPYLIYDAVCLNDDLDETFGEEFISEVSGKIRCIRKNCAIFTTD